MKNLRGSRGRKKTPKTGGKTTHNPWCHFVTVFSQLFHLEIRPSKTFFHKVSTKVFTCKSRPRNFPPTKAPSKAPTKAPTKVSNQGPPPQPGAHPAPPTRDPGAHPPARDQRSMAQGPQGLRAPRLQGSRAQGLKGPSAQGPKSPRDQGLAGLRVQGPRVHRERGEIHIHI